MYSSVEISGFRGLEEVRFEGLSRVNLLVGSNDSGKTSVLESVGVLHLAGDSRVLRSFLELRGEWLPDEDHGRVYDIAQLFSHRDMSGRIRVTGHRSGFGSRLGAVVAELSVQMGPVQMPLLQHGDAGEAADGMLPVRQQRWHGWGADDDFPRVQFVGTGESSVSLAEH